jgi:hypothetical protein
MDLMSGLAGLRAAVELTRALRDAAKAGTLKQDEFAGRVGEIYDYITDSKDALVDAKDQIQDLKDEIRKLKAAADEEESFQFLHGVYWKPLSVRVHDEEFEAIHGAEKYEVRWDGPFCPLCKDDNGKAVRLQDRGGYREQGGGDRSFWCEIHGILYRAPTMRR